MIPKGLLDQNRGAIGELRFSYRLESSALSRRSHVCVGPRLQNGGPTPRRFTGSLANPQIPSQDSPRAPLASRHNHDGVAGCRSSCARATGCAGISGCASASCRAGISGCAGVTGCALRSGRTCRKRKTSTQRERGHSCDNQSRIPHDDSLYLASENYAPYCEQSPEPTLPGRPIQYAGAHSEVLLQGIRMLAADGVCTEPGRHRSGKVDAGFAPRRR